MTDVNQPNEQESDLDEIQEKIEELEEVTRENNKILRKMQSHMRMGTVLSVIYWLFIIGSMIGIYYYLQPFIKPLTETYDQLIGIPEKIKNIGIPM